MKDIETVKHQKYLAQQVGHDLKTLEDRDVQSPSHYTRLSVQPIEFLMSNSLPYWACNVIKYAARAGSKYQPGKDATESELDDLAKILEYTLFRQRQLLGEPITGGQNAKPNPSRKTSRQSDDCTNDT